MQAGVHNSGQLSTDTHLFEGLAVLVVQLQGLLSPRFDQVKLAILDLVVTLGHGDLTLRVALDVGVGQDDLHARVCEHGRGEVLEKVCTSACPGRCRGRGVPMKSLPVSYTE